jgi:hypothetical protein
VSSGGRGWRQRRRPPERRLALGVAGTTSPPHLGGVQGAKTGNSLSMPLARPDGSATGGADLDSESVSALVDAVRDPKMRSAAERALMERWDGVWGEQHDEVLEHLPSLLHDPDFGVRAQTRRILERFADELRNEILANAFTPVAEREPEMTLKINCSRIALARIQAACRDSARKRLRAPSDESEDESDKRARVGEDFVWNASRRSADDLCAAGLLMTQQAEQLQLLVACEWVDFLSGPKKGEREDYFTADWEPQAYRTLVVGSNSTMFHLLKTIQCAFGIDDTSKPFETASTQGSLGLDGIGAILSEPGDADGLSAKISGLEYKDDSLCEVASATLKKVKLTDVLTDRTMTTVHRDRTLSLRSNGVIKGRSTFSLQMHVKKTDAWYAFAVLCHATATEADMASSYQSCVALSCNQPSAFSPLRL